MMEKEQMEIDKKREYDEKLRAEFEKDKANLANKTDRVSLKIEAERKEQQVIEVGLNRFEQLFQEKLRLKEE